MKVLNAFLAIAALITCGSCGSTYNITGTSNVSMMDGQKLYLQVLDDDNWKNTDSCDVVHGEFAFAGRIDSAKWARIYLNDDAPRGHPSNPRRWRHRSENQRYPEYDNMRGHRSTTSSTSFCAATIKLRTTARLSPAATRSTS